MIPGTIPFFSGIQSPTLTFLGSDTDSVDRTSYNFTSFNFGTAQSDRLIVVAYSGSRGGVVGLSSSTIGGISAAPIGEVTTIFGSAYVVVGLVAAVVPTGTSGTINIRYTNTAAKCGIGAWALMNLTSSTVAETTGNLSLGGSMDLSLNTQIGDLIVGSAYVNAITSFSWTGLTEDFDGTIDSNGRQTGASAIASTAATPRTISVSNSSNAIGISALWR